MGPRTWPWHCAREQSSEERRTFTRSPNRRKETTHNNANESTRNATPELVMDKCGRTNLANETPETQDKKKRMQKNAVLRRRRGDERDETYERNKLITRASGTNRGRHISLLAYPFKETSSGDNASGTMVASTEISETSSQHAQLVEKEKRSSA